MAHQVGALASQRDDQLRRIAREKLDPVGGRTAWLVGAAVPAQVGRDGAKSSGGERRQLVSPGEPALGKTVHQDHQRAVPRTDRGAV